VALHLYRSQNKAFKKSKNTKEITLIASPHIQKNLKDVMMVKPKNEVKVKLKKKRY